MNCKKEKILTDSEVKNIPVFILIAKDKNAVDILTDYYNSCVDNGCSEKHTEGILDKIHEFELWQAQNPKQIKQPD